MTLASKRMRSVSVNDASIDFTKYGPTDGSLARARAATVELGGGSAGSASVNSCNSASFTMQRCQHCNVATSRCCWVWSAPGPETPRPRRRWPLEVICPHRGPRAARWRQIRIRCQSGSSCGSLCSKAARLCGVNHQYLNNANMQMLTSEDNVGHGKTKSPAHLLRCTDECLTLRGPLAVPCLKLAQRPVLEFAKSNGSGP